MILKMDEILRLYELLDRLSNDSFPVKTSYKIMKLSKMVEIEKEFFNSEMRKIFDDFAEKDEAGKFISIGENQYKIQKGKEAEAQERIEGLFGLDIDIDFTAKFSLDEFNTIAPKDLFLLEPFLNDTE